MKEIILTQGKVALVDDYVYEVVKGYKWFAHKDNNTYYAIRHASRKDNENGKQCTIRLHHVVIGMPLNKLHVDHIDGNGLNNQRSNLRLVTNRKNHHNQVGHRNGRLVGATYHKRDKIWEAQIRIDNKNYYLGRYSTEQEANGAYLKALRKIEEV